MNGTTDDRAKSEEKGEGVGSKELSVKVDERRCKAKPYRMKLSHQQSVKRMDVKFRGFDKALS